ncbi:MAG: DeoR/GlpR family DNA-binding transcription regulator [Carnobacterium sp.]|uniref:DeoR/GlpR family DNA-binding transcription regulator n=1 Tax=Carnobacterium sp. TaxID=48221 RepID=UPI003315E9D9
MNQLKRQEMIFDLLKVNGEATSNELAVKLDVSMMTINRDLKEISTWRGIQLVHGGAVYRDENTLENPISIKEEVSVQEKKRIANFCRNLVKPGSAVFIETGTTALAVAREIFNIEGCKFYTNSLLVLNSLSKYEGIDLHCVPGKYRELSKGFLGLETADFIRNFNFDVAFIGAEGISADSGITLPNEEDAFTKRAVINQSKKTILVADHKKFGLSYLYKIGDIEEVDMIVTDLDSQQTNFKELKSLTTIISIKDEENKHEY